MPDITANIVEVYAFRRRAARVEHLLLKRRTGDFMGDTWQPVSGTIETGEAAWQAALRELGEESGLTALRMWRLSLANTYYVPDFERVFVSIGFAVEVDAGADVVLSDEHSDQRWISDDEFEHALMWPAQRRFAREVREEVLDGGLAERHMRIALKRAEG